MPVPVEQAPSLLSIIEEQERAREAFVRANQKKISSLAKDILRGSYGQQCTPQDAVKRAIAVLFRDHLGELEVDKELNKLMGK